MPSAVSSPSDVAAPCSSLTRYNVEAMFMQLGTSGFTTTLNRGAELVWDVVREKGTLPFAVKCYQVESNWHGIYLEDGNKPRKHKLEDIDLSTSK